MKDLTKCKFVLSLTIFFDVFWPVRLSFWRQELSDPRSFNLHHANWLDFLWSHYGAVPAWVWVTMTVAVHVSSSLSFYLRQYHKLKNKKSHFCLKGFLLRNNRFLLVGHYFAFYRCNLGYGGSKMDEWWDKISGIMRTDFFPFYTAQNNNLNNFGGKYNSCVTGLGPINVCNIKHWVLVQLIEGKSFFCVVL